MIQSLPDRRPLPAAPQYTPQPTLVLVNGLAEQGISWYRSRDVWQRYFDVHAPGILVYDGPILQERLQQGLKITIDFLTDRLAEFLDKFVQTPPYHLVASSLGGQVAVEYTARHPDKVDRVVLLCPSGMGCEEKLPIAEGMRHNDYQRLVASTFHDTRMVDASVVEYYERKFASRPWRKALFQTVRGTKQHSVRPKLTQISRPTLVICGEEDQIVDPHHVREAVSGLPGFEFVMLPRCGHAPQLEQPQVVNRLVLQFLRQAENEPVRQITGALEAEAAPIQD